MDAISRLFAPTDYQSTKLAQFDTHGNQIEGIWNLTHTSIFDPFYQGAYSRYGMTYTEIRQHIKMFLTDTRLDSKIIERIKKRVIERIPVRSGKTADVIFKSMRIDRLIYYAVHYFSTLLYEYPADRPVRIPGRVQHSSEQGYGEWATYRVTEPLVLSRVSVDHVTPMGNALYNLNDPNAENDVRKLIQEIAVDELSSEFARRWNFVIKIIL